jgi:hypothetical protein
MNEFNSIVVSQCCSYCSLGRYAEALTVIEQRNLPYAWLGASYVAVKANDMKKAEAFGLQFLEHALSKRNYDDCSQLIKQSDFLKVRIEPNWTGRSYTRRRSS